MGINHIKPVIIFFSTFRKQVYMEQCHTWNSLRRDALCFHDVFATACIPTKQLLDWTDGYFMGWQWLCHFWVLFHEICRKSQVNLISLVLTSRNYNLWIIEITFLIIQKDPTCFFLLGQSQFIMSMSYLIRYSEMWSCATKFNLLKNCVALTGNSGDSTEIPAEQFEYSPTDFEWDFKSAISFIFQ